MKRTAIIAAILLVASAGLVAAEDGDPPDAANYGLCTADENNDEGDENSNGTVSETPPFSSLDDEDCPSEPPSGPEDTPADPGGESPDDPGSQAPDDPGSQAPEDPGQPSDPGSQPDDPGSQGDRGGVSFLP